MKLYGLAIAAVPTKDDPNIIKVTCKPVAMEDKKREEFEIVSELAFEDEFSLHNRQKSVSLFERIANTLETIVEHQTQSCKRAGKPYQNVVLEIGQDSRHPIDIESFKQNFFSNTSTGSKLKMARLLDKVVLNLGSFAHNRDQYTDQQEGFDTGQREYEDKLQNLFQQLDSGDKNAAAKLAQEAYYDGCTVGALATENPEIFAFTASKDATTETNPEFRLYHDPEHPEFRDAFLKGFAKHYEGLRYRHPQLPFDSPAPFFVNPVLDAMMEVSQVMHGERKIENLIDYTDVRKQLIAELCQRTVGYSYVRA